MRTDFVFKGLMVPVFTPFVDDKKRTVNYDVIDKYVQQLTTIGMHGIMVNGMTGEGMTLTIDERKKLTEKWFEVTRKYGMKMVVNIGGLPLPEVYELAEHAERLKVDGVLITTDLFYKPKTEEDLVVYLRDIMVHMPTRPVFYYHIPIMTDVYHLDMYTFMKLMEKELPLFAGLYWADDRIDRVVYLKEKLPEFHYIIGTGTSIMAYMVEGFETISMTVMNLYPEIVKEIYDHMLNYKVHDAYVVKQKLVKRIVDLFRVDTHVDWLITMKMEMNKIVPLKVGPVRKPQMTKFIW